VRRLWIPVQYEAMVNAAARAAEVSDWTDIGPGDGSRARAVTTGLALRRRTLVVAPTASAPSASGWDVERTDLRLWPGRGDCASLLDDRSAPGRRPVDVAPLRIFPARF
jgi:hypothetical protein